jgi:drug/metabolite transporter (DMT)-like permease
MKNQKLLGYLLASISTSLMASVGIFVRNISANELTIVLARFGVGFLLLCLYLALTQKIKELRGKSQFSFWNIFSGIAVAWCILFYIKAIETSFLANAVFLLYLGPLIATGLAVIWLKEKLTLVKISLLGVAFFGCFLLLEFKLSFSSINSGGAGWGILSGICYSLFIVANQKISPAIPALNRAFYQLLFGTISLIPFVTLANLKIAQTDWYWLIGIGFCQGFLALTLAISALKRLSAQEYGMIAYLEPLMATLIGLLLYSEWLSPGQALGCALIFTAGVAQIFLTKIS